MVKRCVESAICEPVNQSVSQYHLFIHYLRSKDVEHVAQQAVVGDRVDICLEGRVRKLRLWRHVDRVERIEQDPVH